MQLLQYGDETERIAAKGAGVGGLVGMLLGTALVTTVTGWGIHTDHVRRYEKKIAQGRLLVIANGNPRQVAKAETVLQETDADEGSPARRNE